MFKLRTWCHQNSRETCHVGRGRFGYLDPHGCYPCHPHNSLTKLAGIPTPPIQKLKLLTHIPPSLEVPSSELGHKWVHLGLNPGGRECGYPHPCPVQEVTEPRSPAVVLKCFSASCSALLKDRSQHPEVKEVKTGAPAARAVLARVRVRTAHRFRWVLVNIYNHK